MLIYAKLLLLCKCGRIWAFFRFGGLGLGLRGRLGGEVIEDISIVIVAIVVVFVTITVVFIPLSVVLLVRRVIG